ncbi:MAG: hypothetical protein ABR501_14430 [Pyrinomonadaceae bacterium]
MLHGDHPQCNLILFLLPKLMTLHPNHGEDSYAQDYAGYSGYVHVIQVLERITKFPNGASTIYSFASVTVSWSAKC